MTKFRRITALLLAIILTVGLVPVNGFAQEMDSQTSVDNGELTVEGSNGFGTLLSNEITQQEQAEAESAYPGGYSLSDLIIENGTAKVEYSVPADALLAVALYTDDGLQMLASASAAVTAEDTVAELTFEGEMPAYFQAKAYLLDPYGFSPLCDPFETPMYTEAMQNLLSSTVADYDAGRVWQMSEDDTTNFAVYQKNVNRITGSDTKNILKSADEEQGIYVFTKATLTLQYLTKGSILAYTYGGGELLIIKVAEIIRDGTTVTITAGDVQMEEVFSVVKLEVAGDTSDVTFPGEEEDVPAAFSLRDEYPTEGGEDSLPLTFQIGKPDGGGGDSGDAEGGTKPEVHQVFSLELSGTLEIVLTAGLYYYLAEDLEYLEFYLKTSTTVDVKVEGTVKPEPLPLTQGGLKIDFLDGALSIGLDPKLKVELAADVDFLFTIESTVGFIYSREHGLYNTSVAPKVLNGKIQISGSFKVAVDWGLKAEAVKGLVLAIGMPTETGVAIEAELHDRFFDDPVAGAPEIHDCLKCIGAYLKPIFSVGVEFTAMKDWIKIPFTLFEVDDVKAGVGYYCIDKDEFGWGKCPYIRYLVTVQVKDAQGSNIDNTAVGYLRHDREDENHAMGFTNHNGTLTGYLYGGEYTVMATVGKSMPSAKRKIQESCKILLVEPAEGTEYQEEIYNILYDLEKDHVLDEGTVTGSQEGSVQWKLYGTGRLHVWGSGAFSGANLKDSYKKRVTAVQIDAGITSVGHEAFKDYTDVSDFDIAQTVTSIGNYAFGGCESLVTVDLPDSITEMGNGVFWECTALENIHVPPKVTAIAPLSYYGCTSLTHVTVPQHISSVGYSAFANCTNLVSAVIPEGVTAIESSLFAGCASLTGVNVPGTVTSIGGHAFSGCKLLTAVAVPDGVTTMGDSAFYGCESLTSVSIPHGVTEIGSRTFYNCKSLPSIPIPETVTSIGDYAFYGCESFTAVAIPDGVKEIPQYTFALCKNVTSLKLPKELTAIGAFAFYRNESLPYVEIPQTVTEIGSTAFGYCKVLQNVTLPPNLTRINECVFYDCDSLTEVVIPEGITYMGPGCFARCDNLVSAVIPDTVTVMKGSHVLGGGPFAECASLSSVEMGNNIQLLDTYAFFGCKSLTQILIPASVTEIGSFAFANCSGLQSIIFLGDAPKMQSSAFQDVEATAYYPAGNGTWTEDVLPDYDNQVTWVPSGLSAAEAVAVSQRTDASAEAPEEIAEVTVQAQEVVMESPAQLLSVWGGEYTTDFTDQGVEKTASFSGLVPGAPYVLLAMKAPDPQNALRADNLLYIAQSCADENGNLTFRYIQRQTTDTSYVMAFGAPYFDVKDADISFPNLSASDKPQAVEAVVVYDGKTLTEGVDYILTGTVSFTQPGQYRCTVRGINGYWGSADCAYTVAAFHSHSYTDTVTAPTCTEKGFTTHTCACGDSFVDTYVNPLGHADKSGDGSCDACGHQMKPAAEPTEPEETKPSETPTGPEEEEWVNPFVDVSEDKFYYEPVLWAYYNGITTGKDATHFNPSGYCTRSQVVTFLWRAAGQPEPKSLHNPFPDVPEGKFYTKAVPWAVEQGITNGFKDGTFGPNASCTRGQIVTFLWRYFGEPEPTSLHNPFPDVAESKFYYKAVLWAVENEITGGFKDGTFGPDKTCTRDQIVTFLYRAMVE